jgi:hypothetical protein
MELRGRQLLVFLAELKQNTSTTMRRAPQGEEAKTLAQDCFQREGGR